LQQKKIQGLKSKNRELIGMKMMIKPKFKNTSDIFFSKKNNNLVLKIKLFCSSIVYLTYIKKSISNLF
jgi:hypothetical protein